MDKDALRAALEVETVELCDEAQGTPWTPLEVTVTGPEDLFVSHRWRRVERRAASPNVEAKALFGVHELRLAAGAKARLDAALLPVVPDAAAAAHAAAADAASHARSRAFVPLFGFTGEGLAAAGEARARAAEALKELSEAAALRVEAAECAACGLAPPRAPALTRDGEGWLSVSRAGDHTALHHHETATLTGVLYAGQCDLSKVEGEHAGRLVLLVQRGDREEPLDLTPAQADRLLVTTKPRRAEGGEEPGQDAARCLVLDPTPGSVVVFPGWLPHAVVRLPEACSVTRVAAAFNVFVA